ncbi:MAG: hypothetical protein M3356_03220 [Actinomycetota bacterium]|nr:hypothetical protein [Actinomycetota bacterium]
MEVLRNRLAAALVASAVALSFGACGDDDGKGASEKIDEGAKKGAKKIKKEGKELEDDVKGKDEKKQKDD